MTPQPTHVASILAVTATFAVAFTVGADEPCEPHWDIEFSKDPRLNSRVGALAVYDDGMGAALYAGGQFTAAGGVTVNRIAKLDRESWSPLGSGLNNEVLALTVFDDGRGAALYAGGHFTTAGGVTVNGIAKWDGQSWSPLGSGVNGYVNALTVFDDGTGEALYAGGHFTTAGGLSARLHRQMEWRIMVATGRRNEQPGPCPDGVR